MASALQETFLLLLFGPTLLSWGLRTFQKVRFLQNIPRSKVRSAAMGVVEIQGQARVREPSVSPVSQRSCCWWRYREQVYRSSGKNSRWETVAERTSGRPFFLEDETGRILVDPTDAELLIPENKIPAGYNQRYLEQLILEHAPVFALGYRRPFVDFLAGRRERLLARLRAAKQDPALMGTADANKDGQIDEQEWDQYRQQIEASFQKEEAEGEARIAPENRIILSAGPNGLFILSTRDEKSLILRWQWGAPFAILGGMVMIAVGLWLSQTSHQPLWMTGGALSLGALFTLFRKQTGAFQ